MQTFSGVINMLIPCIQLKSIPKWQLTDGHAGAQQQSQTEKITLWLFSYTDIQSCKTGCSTWADLLYGGYEHRYQRYRPSQM